jgi:hypothetical protein
MLGGTNPDVLGMSAVDAPKANHTFNESKKIP